MSVDRFHFCFPLRARPAKTDRQDAVLKTHYGACFDAAIAEYLKSLPYDHTGEPARSDADFHTVRTMIEYQQPVHLDEDIDVYVRAQQLGQTSLMFLMQIHPQGREALRASGDVVWVCMDQDTRRSSPLPDALVERIKSCESASAS